MHEHVLDGCQPVPLAHYLKALGVLRVVGEQRDPSARGSWRNERFVLLSALDRSALERFFLEEYRPMPIVAPWNGGSGFYPKDNATAMDALAASSASRFADYRETIQLAKGLLRELGMTEKASGDAKATLLRRCRAVFPDHSLRWLDAAYVLSSDGPKYPPLLGTGGNDGRLDFTNNFMQRVLSLLDSVTGNALPCARGLLNAALFDEPTSELLKGAPIGQFLPNHAGGANATSGFAADSLINPWDFVLMLEGATLFAAAAVRRMEQDDTGALSYPFTVRPVGAGYASSAKEDEVSSRAEIWLPLWQSSASASEIHALLSEGRARVGPRAAQNGVDFARAVASLGVDRGLDAFQRYGFQVRNGLAYFAVPLGRFEVRSRRRASLLQEIDSWLDAFRWRANGQNAPASARRALRQLDGAILDLCAHDDALRLQQVLIALGACERVMATSTRWANEARLDPVPALSLEWLSEVGVHVSTEMRLAASLASVRGRYGSAPGEGPVIPLRRQLEPVATWKADSGLRVRWDAKAGRDVAWISGHLTAALNAVLHRRLLLAVQAGTTTYPDSGRLTANLGDIAKFIEGRVDDQHLLDLLWGCILLDWTQELPATLSRRSEPSPVPGALYALLKLCFAGPSPRSRADHAPVENRERTDLVEVPIVPAIQRAAAVGDGVEATRQALRRLRGSGVIPALGSIAAPPGVATRTAAALLFPIGIRDRAHLHRMIERPTAEDDRQTSTPTGATP